MYLPVLPKSRCPDKQSRISGFEVRLPSFPIPFLPPDGDLSKHSRQDMTIVTRAARTASLTSSVICWVRPKLPKQLKMLSRNELKLLHC